MPTVAKEELNPEHLLVLYAVNKAPKGVPTKTHYQKMMFLALKALGNDPKTSAGFRPHHFGPYSAMVEGWSDELINTGYLIKNSEERISVNPTVKADVDTIRFEDELTTMKITELAEFLCSLSYKELLLCIYADDVQKGEGMSEDSDVREDIFENRVDIAVGMTKQGKISVARGAELADVDVMTFREKLQRMS